MYLAMENQWVGLTNEPLINKNKGIRYLCTLSPYFMLQNYEIYKN